MNDVSTMTGTPDSRVRPADHDPKTKPRYTGVPTFMRAPLVDDAADLDIAMIGVPYDGAVSNRPGARHGPREIRRCNYYKIR